MEQLTEVIGGECDWTISEKVCAHFSLQTHRCGLLVEGLGINHVEKCDLHENIELDLLLGEIMRNY